MPQRTPRLLRLESSESSDSEPPKGWRQRPKSSLPPRQPRWRSPEAPSRPRTPRPKVFERLYDDAVVKRQERLRRREDEEKEKELEEQSRQKAPEEQVLAMCERLYERRKKPQPVRDVKEVEKKSFKELEAFAKQQTTWNAKRMARVEAERARQEDSERRWLAERSIHRSVTPRKDLDSTFERLYKDFDKRERRLEKLRAERTPSTRSQTGSEGARPSPRSPRRGKDLSVQDEPRVRARVAVTVIAAHTSSEDAWSCRVDVENSSVSRPVLHTEPCHSVVPRWDATAEAVLLEADELQFTLLKSGEVFGQTSFSAASLLMICASGFHGELSVGCALEVSMKVLTEPQAVAEQPESAASPPAASPTASPTVSPPSLSPPPPLPPPLLAPIARAPFSEKAYRVKQFAVTKAARARSWTPRRRAFETFELEIHDTFGAQVEISKEHLPKHLR